MIKIPTLLGVIITIVGFVILPTILLLTIKSDKKIKILTYIFIGLFFAILAVGVFAIINIGKEVTTIAFDFSNQWANKTINWTFNVDKVDLLLNIFMLIPIGAFGVVSHKNKKLGILVGFVLGFAIGLTIETLQFILPVYRSVQLSDVVLNGISGLIGAIYYYLIYLIRQKIHK